MILRAIVVVTGQRTVTVRYPAHQSGISASLPLTNAGLTVFLAISLAVSRVVKSLLAIANKPVIISW